jgi:hypothetical protein
MSKVKKPRNADPMRRKNAPTLSDEMIEGRLKSWLIGGPAGTFSQTIHG